MAGSPEAENLRLVPHAPGHLRALIEGAEAYTRASGLRPANGLRDFIVSPEVSAEWLGALKDASGPDPWRFGFAVVDRKSGLVIGNAGFTGPPDSGGTVEIAYGIVPEFQGHGYATEAAQALIAWAQENAALTKIQAHTLPEPNASTRVLEKCGFRRIAELVHPTDGPVWRWVKPLGRAWRGDDSLGVEHLML